MDTRNTTELTQEEQNREYPCACYDGVVYIGRLLVTDEGEEVEVVEAVPCRRRCGTVR